MQRDPDLLRALPHRPPARLPQWTETGADGSPLTCLMVEADDYYVRDQSLSAAGVVEAMAQAAAVHQAVRSDGAEPATPGVLIGFEQVEIQSLPQVGETVRISCRVERRVGPALWVESKLAAGPRSVAQGIIKIFLAASAEGRGLAGQSTADHRAPPPVPPATVTSGIEHDLETCVWSWQTTAQGLQAHCQYRSEMGILAGHFPQQPLVPGVYSLELTLLLLGRAGMTPSLPYLIRRSKLARPLLPEQPFVATIKLEKQLADRVRVVSTLHSAVADDPGQLVRAELEVGGLQEV